jgi:transposase
MKCKRNSDGRSIDHATLQVIRQRAVKAVKEGQSPEAVALAFGINTRSLYRWLADFASGGQNALLAKPISGRPPKVTAEEMQWIAQAVKDNTPQQYRFDFGLWPLYQFNKTLSKASISRVMKRQPFFTQYALCGRRSWRI